MVHQINAEHLSIDKVKEIIDQKQRLKLSDDAKQRILKCRQYLDDKLANGDEVFYGINTGFGSLCNTVISKDDLSQLQENLVKSHACGIGEEVPRNIVKLMMLLKIQGLSYGHSGISLEVVERLINSYNEDIVPVVYQQGSLGASGDLAPLAHMSLMLIGEGEVDVNGKRMRTSDMFNLMQWKPLTLRSKEGLALLNGTQFMSAYGVWSLIQAKKLSKAADKVAAISLEAYDCRLNPFNANVNEIRNQQGQIETAQVFRELLKGSEIIAQAKAHVQDPYSFRCIPQVHGASKDTIAYATEIFEREINAVTDNPTIFPDTDEIISAGNFHGQPLALTLDYMGIALAELGNISERRVYQLISGQRGLPAFLVANPGINSGFMIPQYAAASVVSQNKQLATPASVDSIESSNGQEDHVSMGANAATKLYRIVENLKKILAIELFNGSQAIEFRRPLKSSAVLEEMIADYRKKVPFVKEDKYMHPEIGKSIKFIENL
ncbi:histidine ammonia-lyase [Paracrocinitomix mangrovi]|uniref:histidine ammonia-lyase n=1 Tax=Paracrocinitomix mangrovi TaxID=2862509 RepID=UPI001C8D14AA|nr:histidine ammonia-lyase [Paracrocinitomix mangrovi]UKN01802.1 histidine ammonia-lyase [Paracrocinitomix mangrovi]